jgi:pimeloyl-ACP methyl ester carboxylesterase
MVEHCRAALHDQGWTPPYRLLALSLGGMVAAAWCRKYPQEIAGAVLINTSFAPLNPVWQRLRPAAGLRLIKILMQRDAQAAEQHILHLTSGRPHAHQQALARGIQLRQKRPVSRLNALRQLLAAARYRATRQRPAPPTLLLASERDQLVDPRCSRAIASLWKADCIVHPHAGHDLPLDDGDWVATQVAAWLNRLTHRGAESPTAAHAAGTAAARNRPGAAW